jgi:hypothetical protein
MYSADEVVSTPSKQEVLKTTHELTDNKAPCPDMIPAELLEVHK